MTTTSMNKLSRELLNRMMFLNLKSQGLTHYLWEFNNKQRDEVDLAEISNDLEIIKDYIKKAEKILVELYKIAV